MPSKKKKYNARFPAGRIKKIMQTDEEVGKVAQAVPVIISRTLELFVESLLTKALEITSAKNAKTLSPSHMKQCILSESRFDFLKDLVKALPDVTTGDTEDGAKDPVASSQSTNSVGRSESVSTGIRRSQEGCNVQSPREDIGRIPSYPQPTAEFGNRMNPNFYKENNEASISNAGNYCPQVASPPPPPPSSSVFPSAPETEDLEDSGGENEEEYRTTPHHVQPQIGSMVDEDYDT